MEKSPAELALEAAAEEERVRQAELKRIADTNAGPAARLRKAKKRWGKIKLAHVSLGGALKNAQEEVIAVD